MTLTDSNLLNLASAKFPIEKEGEITLVIEQKYRDVQVPFKTIKFAATCIRQDINTIQYFVFEKNTGVQTLVADVSSFFTVKNGCTVDDYVLYDNNFNLINSAAGMYNTF